MKFFNKKSVRAEPENDSNIVNNDDNLLRACLTDEVITRDKAVQISALTGAVDLIANTVANIPIKLYKKEDGNSYIDRYYNRMCTWEIINSQYDNHYLD